MPQHVIDIGSNLDENLKRWSGALARGGQKLDVFNVVYSGKRSRWTAKEISKALKNEITAKGVTISGKKLVGDTLLRQVPDVYPVVYEKIPEVHHYKGRILALAQSKLRRDALTTRRHPKMTITVRKMEDQSGKAREITIDDIDQFSKVRKLKGNLPMRKPLAEAKFKFGLRKLFKESGNFPDWSGETNDFYTNKLKMKGKRHSAAFALKGPGVGVKTMVPGKWGKRGNQIQKLTTAPATVFFLQFEGQINEDSIDQLKKLVEHRAHQERQNLFYGYIERDDSLRLRFAYPKYF
jgi:hypothetical protein